MPTFWTLKPESLHTHASLGSLEKAAETVADFVGLELGDPAAMQIGG